MEESNTWFRNYYKINQGRDGNIFMCSFWNGLHLIHVFCSTALRSAQIPVAIIVPAITKGMNPSEFKECSYNTSIVHMHECLQEVSMLLIRLAVIVP